MLFTPRSALSNDDASILLQLHQLHQTLIVARDPLRVSAIVGEYAALAAYRASAPSVLPSAVTDPYSLNSLRLQMAMQRTTKIQSTISNIMKKMQDSSNAIVANIK